MGTTTPSTTTKNLEVKGIFGQSIMAEGHETDGRVVQVYFSPRYSRESVPLSEIRFIPTTTSTNIIKPFMNAKVEVFLEKIDFPINKMPTFKAKDLLVSETSKALDFPAYWPGSIVSINNERIVVLVKPSHPRVEIQPLPVETTVECLRAQLGYQYGIILSRLKSIEVSIPTSIFPHKKLAWLRSDFYDYHFGNALYKVDTSSGRMSRSESLVKIFTNRGDVHDHISTFFSPRWANDKQKLNLINKINKIHGNMIDSKLFKSQKILVNTSFLSYVLGPKLNNISQIKTTPGVINVTLQDVKATNCQQVEFKIDVTDANIIPEIRDQMEFIRVQLAFPVNMTKNILEEERLYLQRLIEETQIFSIIYDDEPAKATVELNKCFFLNIQTENVTLDQSPVSDQDYGYFLIFGISKAVLKTVQFICEKLNNIFIKSRHLNEPNVNTKKFPTRPNNLLNSPRPSERGVSIRRTSSARAPKTTLPTSPIESQRSPMIRGQTQRSFTPTVRNSLPVNQVRKTPVKDKRESFTPTASNSLNATIEAVKVENQERIKNFEDEINAKLNVHEKLLNQIMSLLTRNLNSEKPLDFNK